MCHAVLKINIVVSSFLSGWQPLTLSGLLQLAYIPECVRIIHHEF